VISAMGKDKKNLGFIVSGHANDEETQTQHNTGHGNDNGKDKDKNK
jgi:hypothetical protein